MSNIDLYLVLKQFNERFKFSILTLLFSTERLFAKKLLPILKLLDFITLKCDCRVLKVCLKWRSTHSRLGVCWWKILCKRSACLKIRNFSGVALDKDYFSEIISKLICKIKTMIKIFQTSILLKNEIC